jgi:hypothetical protein
MRDDFTKETKELLAKRVGYHCSNPGCRQLTSGPQEDPSGFTNIGVAAHITAASAGGPRYDSSLTSAQRRAQDNGIWLCQNCGKLVDSDKSGFSVDRLRTWIRTAEAAAKREVENPRSSDLAQADLEHERLRARLSIAAVRLAAPLQAGKTPKILIRLINVGHATAEKITGAHQGMPGPSLPKWELSEFTEISKWKGQPPPKRDEFYSTNIEPGLVKETVLEFHKLGFLLKAFGADYVKRLGVPAASPGLPTVTPRIFLFGYFDYKTLNKTYRLKFCFSPRHYGAVALVECPQWNGTEEVGEDDIAGRAERHVTADVKLMGVRIKPDDGLLRESTTLSLWFFNIGPTPAKELAGAYSLGNARDGDIGQPVGSLTLPGDAGFTAPPLPSLGSVFTALMLSEISSGAVPLIVEAALSYKDVWNVFHERQFVARYRSADSKFEVTEILFDFIRSSDGAVVSCECLLGGQNGCEIRFCVGEELIERREQFSLMADAREWASERRKEMEHL